MSAAARVAQHVSPERELMIPLVMGTWSLDVTVRFRVSYQSPWHKGHGIDPNITILAATYEDGTDIKSLPMLPGLHEAICLQIEADELELN